jgi:UDP-galactopyranose mutase
LRGRFKTFPFLFIIWKKRKHFRMYDYLIVGAGISGAVVAQSLSEIRKGCSILIMEDKPFVGGNCADRLLDRIPVSKYGPHFFHTNEAHLIEYLGRYGSLLDYKNKVVTYYGNEYLPIPINFRTIQQVCPNYKHVIAYLESAFMVNERVPLSTLMSLPSIQKDALLLRQALYEGYTEKQWKTSFNNVDTTILDRVPIIMGYEYTYFSDTFQVIPKLGYSNLIANMILESGADLELGTKFEIGKHRSLATTVIYSGGIDSLFGYSMGELPYLTTRFDTEQVESPPPFPLINYPEVGTPYTRRTNYSLIYKDPSHKNWVVTETPMGITKDNPLYPVRNAESIARYNLYHKMLSDTKLVKVVGRLGLFEYLNMDQTIHRAKALTEEIS